MTTTLHGVGIHSLFIGNVESVGKEQSGKYKETQEMMGLPILSSSARSPWEG